MATASRVGICNQGIIKVGGNIIFSLEDASEEAIICSAIYDTCLKKCLGDGDWSFATKVSRMATPLATIAYPQWTYRYNLPIDHIRVIKTRDDGDFRIPSTKHEVVGGQLYSNFNPTYVKYIYFNEVAPTYPGDFIMALSTLIAWNLAVPIAQSNKLKNDLITEYKMLLPEARANDGRQSTNERAQSSWLNRVRRQGTGILDA